MLPDRLDAQRSLRGTRAIQSTDTEIVMSQNLISPALTAEQLTAIEGARATLEAKTGVKNRGQSALSWSLLEESRL